MDRYQVTVRSEDDFSERASFVTSYLKVGVYVLGIFLFGVISSFFVWRYIFDNYYLVEYSQKQNEQEAKLIETSLALEEFEHMLEVKDQFTNTFRLYLGKYDSLPPEIDLTQDQLLSSNDEDLVEPLKKSLGNQTLSEIYFLPPINGYSVTRSFDYKTGHYGADIVAKEGEPILAIANGTVIFSSWTDDTGYVIGIQHSDNITSFYKHNSVILKNVGDVVFAGDAIAIIGNSGKLTSGPHLHFEIWHNGQALNPEHYISFEK